MTTKKTKTCQAGATYGACWKPSTRKKGVQKTCINVLIAKVDCFHGIQLTNYVYIYIYITHESKVDSSL